MISPLVWGTLVSDKPLCLAQQSLGLETIHRWAQNMRCPNFQDVHQTIAKK